ncbi:DNA-binding response OmpR family regulator [Natronobacillus azotifigens]|uniref:Response regulator transcription factor n=1 Tax=Natronobacillus azotifigens TaxID=472978 RepID=A0A9J6RET6_9BACI|nr:response regulator transcription factor [Natronobacillus azotifigens]MCZ0704160.1 response regulator transcription factor [Natronobacillus azotifigens]
MIKILLVDDETRMLDLLELYLEPIGFTCEKTISGAVAVEKVKSNRYDVVLLDIMMPEVSGFHVCKQIRAFSNVPIIMLTAREAKEDVVRGLKSGADDYITKPFNEEELIARIDAVLRRSGHENTMEINELTWDESTHELTYMDQTIPLTPKEFSIIGYLIKKPNRVYSREQLIDLIWGMDADTEGRTIDSHVRNMREKVRKSGFPIDDHLKTVWGVGYKWVNE